MAGLNSTTEKKDSKIHLPFVHRPFGQRNWGPRDKFLQMSCVTWSLTICGLIDQSAKLTRWFWFFQPFRQQLALLVHLPVCNRLNRLAIYCPTNDWNKSDRNTRLVPKKGWSYVQKYAAVILHGGYDLWGWDNLALQWLRTDEMQATAHFSTCYRFTWGRSGSRMHNQILIKYNSQNKEFLTFT